MRYNRRKTSIFVVLLLLFIIFLAWRSETVLHPAKKSIYQEPLKAAPIAEAPLAAIQENWEVDETFETHLPLIVIDSGGERPPINMEQDEEGIFWPIPELEPYRQGSIKVIDNGTTNRLTDPTQEESLIQIKRRGNSSMNYEKAQYLIKLVTESGQDRELDFFGMGVEHEWILNGSLQDKSMMRNYLAFRLGDAIIPYTPESLFTEVVYHENGKYYYEGVHLLMENIKQGEERVAIQSSSPSDPVVSYIARRDRIGEDEVILDTWATQEGLSENYLGLIYPTRKNVTSKDIDFVTNDLSRIERVLYSEDPDIFATYSRYIDVASFIDYFLVNEFLANYDAGVNSTYLYKEQGGKLKMGPIWDFDETMDNYRMEPLNYEVTAFQTKAWFDRLMTDHHFIEQLQTRYAELRRGVFSSDYVLSTIDEITEHLGGAIDREWYRWNHIFTEENPLSLENFGEQNELVRNAVSHEVEMYRLKTAVLKHGDAMAIHLATLNHSATTDTGVQYYMPLLLLVAVLAFSLPAYYASRK
ncbi:CotH kinase family protein [Enterococcus olivae]